MFILHGNSQSYYDNGNNYGYYKLSNNNYGHLRSKYIKVEKKIKKKCLNI